MAAALSGSFRLVVLALRQQGFVRRGENPSDIACRHVRSSFRGADFCPDKETAAANPVGLARPVTQYGRKSARENRYGFDSRHLKKL